MKLLQSNVLLHRFARAAIFTIATALLCAFLAGHVLSSHGDLRGAVDIESDLASDGLNIPRAMRVGQIKAGVETRHDFDLNNFATDPITITAVDTDCSCTTVCDLPRTLPPKSLSRFEIVLRPGFSAGQTQHSLVFHVKRNSTLTQRRMTVFTDVVDFTKVCVLPTKVVLKKAGVLEWAGELFVYAPEAVLHDLPSNVVLRDQRTTLMYQASPVDGLKDVKRLWITTKKDFQIRNTTLIYSIVLSEVSAGVEKLPVVTIDVSLE